jgi:hypothetical protein
LIKFYCEPNPTSFVDTAFAWVDNCSFVENGGVNKVTNGGFEDWAVGVEDHPGVNDAFNVYPNPAEDFINLTSSVNIDYIHISDLSGKVLLINEMKGSDTRLDISNLSSGIYVLQFFEDQYLRGSLKLIKK